MVRKRVIAVSPIAGRILLVSSILWILTEDFGKEGDRRDEQEIVFEKGNCHPGERYDSIPQGGNA